MNKHIFLPVLFFFILFGCNNAENNNSQNKEEEKQLLEDKILEAVTVLPEYKEADQIIRAMTSGKQQLTCIINEPEGKQTQFLIEAGYNKETWFEPYYNFYVDPITFKVSIYDKTKGDIVPLEIWRKRENE